MRAFEGLGRGGLVMYMHSLPYPWQLEHVGFSSQRNYGKYELRPARWQGELTFLRRQKLHALAALRERDGNLPSMAGQIYGDY